MGKCTLYTRIYIIMNSVYIFIYIIRVYMDKNGNVCMLCYMFVYESSDIIEKGRKRNCCDAMRL